ncbi:hypothetical protein AMELA_G00254570 [Ameiurus melas]|uniref:Uncharacterized protein n=1 Tax=Ameiurus melas TaxID=219545 RepID=A0A7J5ZTK6_AMEME|nr:hypothetical protein AMELA_G00254570 [Ameiurus melas]
MKCHWLKTTHTSGVYVELKGQLTSSGEKQLCCCLVQHTQDQTCDGAPPEQQRLERGKHQTRKCEEGELLMQTLWLLPL